MPHDFHRKTEDASCCRKICSAFADRRTKTEPRHSQELLDRSNTDENFLKNVITGDETWEYGYDVETNVQSSQWVVKSSPRLKKARQCRSNVKVMLIFFFYWKGIVHHEFVPRGETVNKEFYLKVMKRLREAV